MCDDPIMADSIYWYDYETTGIDPARDRVLQFAGVRTDMDLNVISEPLDLFCKPGDDVLPSPDAILVTGIKMSEVLDKGLTETKFIEKILAEFTVSGTCVAGLIVYVLTMNLPATRSTEIFWILMPVSGKEETPGGM